MPTKPKFTYDPNARRYRQNGKFVAQNRVRSWVDKAALKFGGDLEERAADLLSDPTPEKAEAFFNKMRRELKAFHRASTVIALGGRDAAKEANSVQVSLWNQADAAIAEQMRYFDNFRFEVATGQKNVDGRFGQRVKMYGHAVYSTFENAVRLREQMAGMREERRVTRSGNPCEDCAEQAGRGWQPIGTLKVIGRTQCLVNCRCRFEFKK